MLKVGVLGPTGTAGSRVIAKLKERGLDFVEVSRSKGVDLITGSGLREALLGAEVVIDASNPVPADASIGLHEAFTSAARNVVAACESLEVQHLVLLSILGIDAPAFDSRPYYAAKRAQEKIVNDSDIRSTLVKSSQWYEFATNPSAVTFHHDEVVVEDWLIKPVAVDTVADVLVDTAIREGGPTMLGITGPDVIRLPELTARLLARLGDHRPIRATAPSLAALAEGVLLPPEGTLVLPPDVSTWLANRGPSK